MSTTTDKNTSPYILMTGATGLLGSYLVRDLLMSGRRLALIVRRDRKKTPASRMELLLRHWDETLGYTLPRPIVLEGDLSQPLCGLDNDARSWVTSNCDALLNNAASLSFRGSDPTAEPWLTNVTGTTNVLALAKETGLRQMHHVSTAYEKSKVASEQLVRSAEHFDTATIYRPSIIAGDSQTGYTSTYHGLFAALRLGHTLLTRVVKGSTSGPALLALIGVDPKAHKNFVPVDWVSSVISHLIQTPSAHGKTFHVTHPAPCSMDLVGRFIQEAVERYSKDASPDDPDLCDEQWFADTMLTQLDVYTSYFRHDPTFDQTNVTAFASHLPCPVLDMPRLLTMARFAIANDFGRLSVKIPATAPELTCNASLPQEVSDENQIMANANQGACLNVPFAPADSI